MSTTFRVLPTLLLGLLIVGGARSAPAQDAPITVRAGLLIDGTGGETVEGARLFIENGHISRIDRLRGSVTYDLSAYTVMPGWIDTHVHLTSHFDAEGRLAALDEVPDSQTMLHAVANAQRTLRAGFTTVQSLGHPLDALLRDAVARGAIDGPRILTSLGAVTYADASDVSTIRLRVRELATRGADVVKIFASDSIRDGGLRALTDELIAAACEEADSLGLRTAVHAYGTEVVTAVIEAGCTSIEHGNNYDAEVVTLLAERGTYLDSHLGLLYANYTDHRDAFFGTGNFTANGYARMEQARGIGLETFRRTVGNDAVQIVFGSDAVAGAHGRNAEELIARADEGFQREMDVIVSATSRAATALGLGDRIGTLGPGFVADLVAVEGNPLDNMETVRNVRWVMQGGRVVRNELPQTAPPRPSRGRGR